MITPPDAAALTFNGAIHDLAITPDGTRVIYRGANTLFVRALDQIDETPLTGLGAPAGPFVSPDSQWIGCADGGGTLKKVAITGGPAVALARLNGPFRGATWAPDGAIIFATQNAATGLQRISAGGGEPMTLTRPDRAGGEARHYWPTFLPGGRTVLFTIISTTGGRDQNRIAVLDLETGAQTTLIRGGSDARYVPSGHLVYGAAGTLRAVAFDLSTLAVVGTPVPVVSPVVTTSADAVDFAVGGDGTLVYVPGAIGSAAEQRTLVWVDRQGQETPIPGVPPRSWASPRLSPDGTRVALDDRDGELDIWTFDFARQIPTRLTFDSNRERGPVWTPDGRRLAFEGERDGKLGM